MAASGRLDLGSVLHEVWIAYQYFNASAMTDFTQADVRSEAGACSVASSRPTGKSLSPSTGYP